MGIQTNREKQNREIIVFLLTFSVKDDKISSALALLARLDRVTGYEPVGRGFESLAAHQTYAKQKPNHLVIAWRKFFICNVKKPAD